MITYRIASSKTNDRGHVQIYLGPVDGKDPSLCLTLDIRELVAVAQSAVKHINPLCIEDMDQLQLLLRRCLKHPDYATPVISQDSDRASSIGTSSL